MFADETELIQRIAVALIRRKERMGVAESCTGGLIAACCTLLAGSSEWFERGFVTYSNAAKQYQLGVPAALIDTHGAVSEAVVRAMAEGALAHSAADWSLAVTGVAGPGGGSDAKPVGTVWLALGQRGGATCAERQVFSGDRSAVRSAAVARALAMLAEALEMPAG